MRTDGVDAGYLRHYFSSPSFRRLICDGVTGVGGSLTRAQPKRVAQFPVPIAPLPEQKRITNKLDALLARLDACRDRLDRVPDILKRFRQSVLANATSGELTREWRQEHGLPFTWTPANFGSAGEVTGGITKNSGRKDAPLRRRYLRVANVYSDRLALDDIAEIATTQGEFERTRLRSGDLLIVEGNGSMDQIGRAAMWRGEIDECAHQNHLIRWRTRGDVMPAFGLYWLLSPTGRTNLVDLAKSSAGLYTLSLSKIAGVPIMVPSLPEQSEIVRRIQILMELADRLQQRLERATGLVEQAIPSTLAKAFRGKLVPQDPNDPPASELLARIRHREDQPRNAIPGRTGKRPPRNISKTESNMLTRKDVSPDHLTSILRQQGPLEAPDLWAASQLEIDDFYDQLKEEEAQKLLCEKRSDGDRSARLLEAVA